MEKLINEIVSWLNTSSKTDKRLSTAYTGIVLSILFFTAFYVCIRGLLKMSEHLSPQGQEVVSVLCLLMLFAAIFAAFFYLVKYMALLLITISQYGLTPSFKNREDSIEAIMTSEVDDKARMHKEIVAYLKECSTPRHFAALYIWLNESQLLDSPDQKQFLTALQTDFPGTESSDTSKQIQVPSPSSFSEFKTKLEKDDRKDYRESGFNRLFEKRFRRFMKD